MKARPAETIESAAPRQTPEDVCDTIVREAYGKVARDSDTRLALEMWKAEEHAPKRNDPPT